MQDGPQQVLCSAGGQHFVILLQGSCFLWPTNQSGSCLSCMLCVAYTELHIQFDMHTALSHYTPVLPALLSLGHQEVHSAGQSCLHDNISSLM